MLAGELAKKIDAKPKCVRTAYQAHSVLVLPVVGVPELRNVGGATKASNPQAGIVGLIGVEAVGREKGKVETDAAIIEAELVRPTGINNVSVGKTSSQRLTGERIVETGKVVQRRRRDRAVVEPAKAHILFVGDFMVDTNLMVIVQG